MVVEEDKANATVEILGEARIEGSVSRAPVEEAVAQVADEMEATIDAMMKAIEANPPSAASG